MSSIMIFEAWCSLVYTFFLCKKELSCFTPLLYYVFNGSEKYLEEHYRSLRVVRSKQIGFPKPILSCGTLFTLFLRISDITSWKTNRFRSSLFSISSWNQTLQSSFQLLLYKQPYFSDTKLLWIRTKIILCKIWGFHGGDYEECRPLGYKTQFVPHRRRITSPLQSPDG
jgi:hypothetical protein